MVLSGDYRAALAFGPKGEIGGGLLWRKVGSAAVEAFGPYLFGQPAASDIASRLVDACIAAIARTEAVSLFLRYAPRSYPTAISSFSVKPSSSGRTVPRSPGPFTTAI